MRLIAVILLGFGCKAKPAEDKPPTNTIAMRDAAPPKPTADDLAATYERCMRSFTDAKWDDFRSCYAPGATFETPGLGAPHDLDAEIEDTKKSRIRFADYEGDPQLVIASGHDVVAIVWIKARRDDRKIGIFLGHVVTYDGHGRATRDRAYFDAPTIEAQATAPTAVSRGPIVKGWPTKMAQVAKHDPTEQANLATFGKLVDASNKHDARALGDLLTDDVTWSSLPRPQDFDKRALLANFAESSKGFAGAITVEESWAAGNYVAAIERLAGSADTGAIDSVALPVFAVYEFTGDKVKAAWLFYQTGQLRE